MTKGNELQLLVCSGNLGNAQPDLESLAAWIPENGRCRDALKYPANHPIKNQFSTFEEYTEIDQFDIIVIGMQEATFDPPVRKRTSSGDNLGMHIISDHNSNNNEQAAPPPPPPPPPPKPKKGITTTLFKKVSELSTYVTSRDYTKKGSNVRSSITGASRTDSNEINYYSSGTALLHDSLERRLPSYTRTVSYQRGQMLLEVFVLTTEEHQIQVEVIHTKAQNTGRAGLANKGGIVTELLVNGKTRLAFLTAHLEAHEGYAKYQMRCSSLADILNGTREKIHDISLTSHYAFVMGDLNFRTELQGKENLRDDDHKEIVFRLVNKKNWEALNQADELHRALRCKDCLVGFQTLQCNFPPTFKMERKQGYTYIDKRRPSYTDRILWSSGHELDNNIRPLLYEPIENFSSSDHKPIRAAFAISLNEPMLHRAKMARRRSAIQLAGFSNQNKNDSIIPHNKRLRLFLSDIHCFLAELDTSNSKSSPPNPYICLLSDPKEVFKVSKTRWDLWKKCFSFGTRKDEKSDTTNQTSMQGWPQSSVQKGTYQPSWEGEAFNADVKAYRSDGSPLDLTGSMIRFTVMNNRQSGTDEVLGTFCYNLGNLVRTYKPPSPKREHQSARQRRGSIMGKLFHRQDEPQADGGADARRSDPARSSRRSSIMNMVFRRQEEPQMEEEPVMTFPIDAPLVRNGLETGRIRFTMEAWWMDANTAKLLGADGQRSVFSLRHSGGAQEVPRLGRRRSLRKNNQKHIRHASRDGVEQENYDDFLTSHLQGERERQHKEGQHSSNEPTNHDPKISTDRNGQGQVVVAWKQ